MADRGVKAFIALSVLAVLIVVVALASYQQSRPESPRTTENPFEQAAEDAFTEAGIADEMEERFGALDADAALEAAQELSLEGARRVEGDVLVERLRMEARMVEAVPPASCAAIAMGAVTPDVVGEIERVLQRMSEAEAHRWFTMSAALVKAALTEQPLRTPLTPAQMREAERSFAGLFTMRELDRLVLLDPASGARLTDAESCRIVRKLYRRILTLPEKQLELVSVYMVDAGLLTA